MFFLLTKQSGFSAEYGENAFGEPTINHRVSQKRHKEGFFFPEDEKKPDFLNQAIFQRVISPS